MEQGHQAIVESLYALYKDKGFLSEEEALTAMSAHGVSLVGINRLTNKLIALGVIFSDELTPMDDDDKDRARTDYDAVYREVLEISPGQRTLIDYIKNVRPPQYREWRPLVIQANSDNAYAFNRLFDMYLRIVVRIALRFHKEKGFELDDAIQEGSMGLIRGIKQYDSSKHDTIVSYLPFWIQQYLDRAIADKGRTIRVPVHAYEIAQRLLMTQKTLFEQERVEPSYAEIATEAQTSSKTAMTLIEVMQEPISMEYFLKNEANEKIIYKYFAISSFEDEADNNFLAESLQNSLSALNERERDVLALRYGLYDGKERTLEEIGAHFKLTRERVRQIEAKAFKKLRHPARVRHFQGFI